MTAVARDEVEHLAVVCRLLSRRGGRLTKSHANPYASELHKLVRRGQGVLSIVALGGVKDELDAAITDLRPAPARVGDNHPSRAAVSSAGGG